MSLYIVSTRKITKKTRRIFYLISIIKCFPLFNNLRLQRMQLWRKQKDKNFEVLWTSPTLIAIDNVKLTVFLWASLPLIMVYVILNVDKRDAFRKVFNMTFSNCYSHLLNTEKHLKHFCNIKWYNKNNHYLNNSFSSNIYIYIYIYHIAIISFYILPIMPKWNSKS